MAMKLVVGLGNPGAKYRGTRHNVGFDVIAELANRHLAERPKAKFQAEVAEVRIANQKCLLISPLTYMNLSGKTVQAAVQFYKTSIDEDLLVITDDMNLDVGRLRIRARGSAGGQNGIKDIIARVGSQEFSRLRIGVGRLPAGWDAANFVLGKFDADNQPTMEAAVKEAADAVECWVGNGVQAAMNQFNAAKEDKNTIKKSPEEPSTGETKI